MTEYWVSQAKHYCKYCKQWMADNKVSRQLHEQSERHRQQVQFHQQKQKNDRLHGARSEKDLKQQLDAINRAAQSAVANDIQGNTGFFYSSQQRIPPRPPPDPQMVDYPPSTSNDVPITVQQQPRPAPAVPSFSQSTPRVVGSVSDNTDKAISENLRQDSSGMYTVNGVTYLEGQYYEHRLVADARCEIFIEEEDTWCKARIIRSRVVAIAHTDLETKSFDVSYVPASRDEWSEEDAIELSDVKSDQLRLIQDLSEATPNIDLSTGFGKWETVSVRIVDEVEEQKKQAKQEVMEEEKKKKEEKKKNDEEDYQNSAYSDNALGSYDVYNTGVYKGVRISKSEASSLKKAEEMESVANGKEVGFKKRPINAGNSQMKAKKRNIRKKSNDES